MNTSQQLVVNKLPTRTWNHLNVNEATIPWNAAETADLGTDTYQITAENRTQPLHIDLTGAEGYSRKHIAVDVAAGVQATVYMVLDTQGSFAVETAFKLHDAASLRLVQVLGARSGALLYAKTDADCAPGAGVDMMQILMGQGDLYSDNGTELVGDGSRYSAQIGYLGRGSQTIDVNVVVNHYGKNTECEIDTSGALKDAAKKVFRGTIDFKTGSSNSVGNEKETVLMLGDDVVNKTVPLILCAEENVVGNHGATIGELDDETLFYFESRGISRAQAENILARASIERFARTVDDEALRAQILQTLEEELNDDV